MPETLRAQALLFDMDGTVIDSGAVVERIWTTFARRFDLDVAEILKSSHGVRMVETIRTHAPQGTDAEQVTRELGEIEIADNDGIVAIDGAPELFASLRGGQTALVTSATRPLAEVRMAVVGIPLPTAIVTAEDVERGKPAPDCYLLAAERLGADPAECVVFEDAEAGIQAGLAAGMRVVVVGEWLSPTTAGLSRIPDYAGVRARAIDGMIELTLP